MRAPTRIGQLSAVRVRLDACPCCRRPLVLDHCGNAAGDDADQHLVEFAQRLHVATCPG